MYYIARISTGMASAIAADRAITRYGRNKVWLHFSDVQFEDEDNHRFLADCMKRWGGKLITAADGRTPLQVFEDHSIIPNSGMAPCSAELKIKVFAEWLWRVPKPVTILSGLGWHEPHRINRLIRYHEHGGKWRAPQGFSRRIPGVYEDFPLMWRPIETRTSAEVVRSWGITPPRMYRHGFPHANCGGRCVRQGIDEWRRLLLVWPERFREMRDWEQAQRARGGARAEKAICRSRVGGVSTPVTLAELEQRWSCGGQAALPMFEVEEDAASCFCTDA